MAMLCIVLCMARGCAVESCAESILRDENTD